MQQFKNPISELISRQLQMLLKLTEVISSQTVPGFNPDPSCICVDGVFYLVTSSFLFFPGIPVYASRDLINWVQIGNVVSRPSQLARLNECEIRFPISGGLWAPTIRYHQGQFYVTVTLVFPQTKYEDPQRWDNTEDPRGDWSDPVKFDYPGYDTSLSWDEKGVAHVQGSFYWRVRSEISQIKIDTNTGKTLNEDGPRKIWSGDGGKAPEAPHAYYREGWWWLIIAEGGTELGHRSTMARSRSLTAPPSEWERCPTNPVLSSLSLPQKGQSNNDPSADPYFLTVGHAELFQSDSNGKWFAVALATREGVENFAMGRETVLVDVEWDGKGEDGELNWPKFGNVRSLMNAELPSRVTSEEEKGVRRLREGETEDLLEMCASEYQDGKWPLHLLFLRLPDVKAYSFDSTTKSIILRPSSTSLRQTPTGTTTLIARRQTDLEGSMTVTLSIPNDVEDIEAGLTVYLDETHHFALTCTMGTKKGILHLRSTAETEDGKIAEFEGNCIDMKVEWTLSHYSFYTRESKNEEWNRAGQGRANDVSGGFTGVVLGVFASGHSTKEVRVEDWRYESKRTW